MFKRCRTVFDEPVKVLVWEWDEALLGLAIFGLGQFLIGPFWSTGVAVVVLAVLYRVKQGKPAGAVVHWLYRVLGRYIPLPGMLPPGEHTYSPWP